MKLLSLIKISFANVSAKFWLSSIAVSFGTSTDPNRPTFLFTPIADNPTNEYLFPDIFPANKLEYVPSPTIEDFKYFALFPLPVTKFSSEILSAPNPIGVQSLL